MIQILSTCGRISFRLPQTIRHRRQPNVINNDVAPAARRCHSTLSATEFGYFRRCGEIGTLMHVRERNGHIAVKRGMTPDTYIMRTRWRLFNPQTCDVQEAYKCKVTSRALRRQRRRRRRVFNEKSVTVPLAHFSYHQGARRVFTFRSPYGTPKFFRSVRSVSHPNCNFSLVALEIFGILGRCASSPTPERTARDSLHKWDPKSIAW